MKRTKINSHKQVSGDTQNPWTHEGEQTARQKIQHISFKLKWISYVLNICHRSNQEYN